MLPPGVIAVGCGILLIVVLLTPVWVYLGGYPNNVAVWGDSGNSDMYIQNLTLVYDVNYAWAPKVETISNTITGALKTQWGTGFTITSMELSLNYGDSSVGSFNYPQDVSQTATGPVSAPAGGFTSDLTNYDTNTLNRVLNDIVDKGVVYMNMTGNFWAKAWPGNVNKPFTTKIFQCTTLDAPSIDGKNCTVNDGTVTLPLLCTANWYNPSSPMPSYTVLTDNVEGTGNYSAVVPTCTDVSSLMESQDSARKVRNVVHSGTVRKSMQLGVDAAGATVALAKSG